MLSRQTRKINKLGRKVKSTKKFTQQILKAPIEEDKRIEEEHKYIESDLKDVTHRDNDFCCGICLNYIVSATSTKCGHTYCEMCLQEYLLFVKTCPLCPEDLRKSKCGSCLTLDQLILDFIKNYHPEELDFYEKRKLETRDWKERRQVKSFEVGEKLDVRDPNHVWKVGTIKRLKVSHDAQKTRFLVIHYDEWSERYDEEILETSPRFAALSFYTSRKDIPRYNRETQNPFLRNMVIIEQEDKLLYLQDNDTSASE